MHIVFARDRLRFSGSDGDITVCAWAPADCEENGELILPGKLLAEVARTLPDKPVTLTDGTLSCGRATFTFGVSRDSYPGPYATAPLLYSAEGLPEAFAKVTPMAAKDAIDAYGGVFLEVQDGVLRVTATNRYRLATVAVELKEAYAPDGTCLVPASSVSSFPDGETEFGWDAGVATFLADGYSVTTRRLTGVFPPWRRLMPDVEPTTEIETKTFREMIARARVMAAEDEPVTLSASSGILTVSTGAHSEDLEADVTQDFSCLLGIENLLGVLKSCEQTFRLGYTESLKPVHIHSGAMRAALLPRREV
jgi:DNA polymerase-3 subunit beta